MSFAVSIRQAFMSGASPGVNVTMLATPVAAATANVTVAIPAPQYFNFGMVRVKSATPAAGTFQINSISASDGTTTTQLHAGQRTTVTFPADCTFSNLITDLKATSLIISLTAAQAGSVDIEFAGV